MVYNFRGMRHETKELNRINISFSVSPLPAVQENRDRTVDFSQFRGTYIIFMHLFPFFTDIIFEFTPEDFESSIPEILSSQVFGSVSNGNCLDLEKNCIEVMEVLQRHESVSFHGFELEFIYVTKSML